MKASLTNAVSNSCWISKRYTVAAYIALVALIAASSPLYAQATTFDHSAFDSLLHRYVVNGMVDYDGFKRSPEFVAYLQRLAHFDPAALPEAERLAFWINAYNCSSFVQCLVMGAICRSPTARSHFAPSPS